MSDRCGDGLIVINRLRPLFLSIFMIAAFLASGQHAIDRQSDGAQSNMAMEIGRVDCGMADCPHNHDGMHGDANGLCSGAAGSCVTAMIRLIDWSDTFGRDCGAFAGMAFDKTGPSRFPETETPPPRA